jgi:hypothetical protein
MRNIVPIHPWPMHPKVAEVVNAIEGINPIEALPGGPGPVLAIRQAPPFVCDAIVVMRPDRVPEAVKLIVGDGLELVTVRDWVKRNFGIPDDHGLVETIEATGTRQVRFQ